MHRRIRQTLLVTALAMVATDVRAQVRPPESIIVDRTDDLDIRDCQALTSGDCTLRGALSKALPGDIIIFDDTVFPANLTPPTTIAPTSPLPPITLDQLTLWGTAGGTPRVRILGTSAGQGAVGIDIRSSGNFVRGLWIEGFSGAGIRVTGANNTLGGISECGPSQAHVIVKNRIGIHITGEAADNNRIVSSFVGSFGDGYGAPVGLGDGGNQDAGVLVDDGADDNGIGAGCYGIRIAGNEGDGLIIRGADTTNNYFNDGNIGGYGATDGNSGNGVLLDGSSGFRVGHAVNIINNGGDGVRMTGATASRNNISQTYDSAQISQNGGLAINLVGGLEDDFGVTTNDADDSDAGPNGLINAPVISAADGAGEGMVEVRGRSCPSCTIRLYRVAADPSGHGEMGGGLTQTWADMTGNWQATVRLGPGGWVTATATDAEGNTSELSKNAQGPLEITVDRTDDALVADCTDAPSDCTLRGALTIARRGDTINFAYSVFPNESQPGIITLEAPLPPVEQGSLTIKADSGRPRVWIDGSALGANTDGLTITSGGNFIQGLRLMGFSRHGLVIDGGANNRVGWPECGSSNGLWLSGNGGYGVVVRGESADGNAFYYTLVGSESGLAGDANRAGGIAVEGGADDTSIGGSACYGPVILGNGGSGIVIRGAETEGTRINSLTIGRQGAGNAGHGILIEDGRRTYVDHVVNIEYNSGDGIRVAGGSGHTFRPTYSSSSIRNNGGLAINLVASSDPADGVTPNDPGDGDEGPNGLLNSPVISTVESQGGGRVRISGTACGGCSVNLHEAAPDPSGHGELGTFLGSAWANPEGQWTTDVNLGSNTWVTGLAYDASMNTSEAAANVPGPRALVVDRTDDLLVSGCRDAVASDCSLRGALTTAVAGDTIRFHTDIFPPGNYYSATTVTWINLTSPLPPLTVGRLTLDGGTANDPSVGIDGGDAGESDGLVIRSDGNYVQGLRIANFSGHGLVIDGGARNEIGRNRDICGPTGGNTLTDNGGYGVVVRGESADDNNIRYNKIGYRPDNVSGPNALGGILVTDGADNTGLGNGQCYGVEIHGNGGPGITMRGASTEGAYIGEGYIGRPNNPNQGDGVLIEDASHFRTGWVLRIESNTGAGLRVTGAKARDIRIGTPMYYSSTIRDNGGLGVDLVGDDRPDGVTPNDRGDRDEGPNRLQNFPIVYWVRGTGDGYYALRGQSCPNCSVNVFNAALDPSGHGEAASYLGQTSADGFGIWQVNVYLGAPTPETILTLNAVDPQGNMSEFGANLVVFEKIQVTDICGNGTREANEPCDDGNLVSGDGCSSICEVEVCGDGVAQPSLGETCDGGCDDGNACTVEDRCDAACGQCQAGVARNCDDGNPCTVDACDPQSGCTHRVETCDDGNSCTRDACEPGRGCVNEPIAANGGNDATCDGADDDCDGDIDEDYVGAATSCGSGPCAATGRSRCEDGKVVTGCTPKPAPSATDTLCDGADEDCDGDIDDDVGRVSVTCGVGVCAGQLGERRCEAGVLVDHCDATAKAGPEDCDGLDDDCDGFVDNAVSGSPTLSVCPIPETRIVSGPESVTTSTVANFAFEGTDAVGFECALDGAASTRCDSGSATYTVGPGQHTFTVRAVGAHGLVDPTAAYWNWTVDDSAPDTRIDSAPADPAQSSTATFRLGSNVSDVTYVCTLDGMPVACAAETTLTGLTEGEHTFTAAARTGSGLVDPVPARHVWRVDLTAPETSITAGPTSPSGDEAAAFALESSSEAVTFECRVDDGAFGPCDAQVDLGDLAEGAHRFEARAIDEAGNVDPTPAVWTWTVDLTGPEVSVVSGPAEPSQSGVANFEFATNEPADLYCALDVETALPHEQWTPCEAYWTLTDLDEGRHEVQVIARDEAGNWSEVERWIWHIAFGPPETTIVDGPPSVISQAETATFTFKDPTERANRFECQTDEGGWEACDTGTLTLAAGLSVGDHALSVRGCVATLCDPTPAERSWEVSASPCPRDADAPVLTCVERVERECAENISVGESDLLVGATDACGAPTVSIEAPASYALGDNPVVVVAVDGQGNRASCAVPVRLVDTKAPALTCPTDVTVVASADACDAAPSVGEASVTDDCDGTGLVVGHDAPARFPVGETTVTFMARDRSNLEGTCATRVTVRDETAPAVACAQAEGALGGELVPTASDACGATVAVDGVTCVAIRPDGSEVTLEASGCPATASGDRVVLGGPLEGAFDGDLLEVRYRVQATDPSTQTTEVRCAARVAVSDLPISPDELRAESGAGCSGGRDPMLLVGLGGMGLALAARGRGRGPRARRAGPRA